MLEVRGLSKVFQPGAPSEKWALRDLDLSVQEGSFVVIIGTNGAGKSVLMNAIMGTYPADGGTIHLGGRDMTDWPEHRRAAFIGRVWESPAAGTAPTLTVADNLALATRRGGWHGLRANLTARHRQALGERLHLLGINLDDRLKASVASLSPLERQILALVMATWCRPQLLLLDGFSATLDPRSAEQLLGMTEQIVQRDRLTTLLVTHSLPRAINLGDRLLMMHQGRIVHDFRGAEKRRLRVDDLLARFEAIRQSELLDESAGDLLSRSYV